MRVGISEILRVSGALFSLAAFQLAFANPGFADQSTTLKFTGPELRGAPGDVSIQEIEELGLVHISAFNPDEHKIENYSGVWLHSVVEQYASPEIKQLTMTAIDLYTIDFFPKEWRELRVLLATRVDGEYLDFSTKGPMRVVFVDYDPKMAIYQETLPKWIWMITEVNFKN